MNKKIGIILAVVLIALLAMGSVSAGWFDFLGGNSNNKVTIGYLPSDHDSALFVADCIAIILEFSSLALLSTNAPYINPVT